MKIVYLVASSDISGGQRIIFQQAEELAKRKHDVTLACPEPKPQWFPIRHAKWEMAPFSESKALGEADVRVATYWPTVPHAVSDFEGPVFHLCQGYEADLSFNRPLLEDIKAAYASDTIKLAVSPHVEARLKSVGYPQVVYVGQAFDHAEFPPAKKRNFHTNSPIVILAGIFESDVKGIHETLRALRQLQETGASFRLRRISTWPQSEKEKQIFPAHVYDLRLMPEEMAIAYREADLLIGASHPEEGFGLPVLEALSSGLPTLLSDTPAHRHIAADAACYFKCGESRDIFRKLIGLLENRPRRQELSEMGPIRARRFYTPKVVDRLLRIFKTSLEKPVAPTGLNFEKTEGNASHPFTVLWPVSKDPEIDEIRFSHRFCRKMCKRFCDAAYPNALWLDYSDSEKIAPFIRRAEGEILILVNEPETVLSPQAIDAFLYFARAGHDICGPVYNETAFPAQTASLPMAYVDIASFLEVAEIVSKTQSHSAVQTDILDPACISFHLDLLKKHAIPHGPEAQLKDFKKIPARRGTVARGALVHSRFINAFATERDDLVRLVPADGISRVLDVGCAMGGYGKTLKRRYPDIFLTAVEMNPSMAETAGHIYDEMITAPIEEARFSRTFDLINCGELLEHLPDPWKMLSRFYGLLRDGGYLVLCIPNVGHWSVARALLKGSFQYIPIGLLCISHLRWFTESSIRDSLESEGFEIEVFERQQIPPTPEGRGFIRHVCHAGLGDRQSLETNEFFIRAAKKGE